MIRLDDEGWVIDVDNDSYILAFETGKLAKGGSGKMHMKRRIYGWYPSMQSALRAYRSVLNLSVIRNGEMTIQEALEVLDANDKKIESMITEYVKG